MSSPSLDSFIKDVDDKLDLLATFKTKCVHGARIMKYLQRVSRFNIDAKEKTIVKILSQSADLREDIVKSRMRTKKTRKSFVKMFNRPSFITDDNLKESCETLLVYKDLEGLEASELRRNLAYSAVHDETGYKNANKLSIKLKHIFSILSSQERNNSTQSDLFLKQLNKFTRKDPIEECLCANNSNNNLCPVSSPDGRPTARKMSDIAISLNL